jgi:hypothetical protein
VARSILFDDRANYLANLRASVSDPLTDADMSAIAGIDRNCRLIKGQVFLWKAGQSWRTSGTSTDHHATLGEQGRHPATRCTSHHRPGTSSTKTALWDSGGALVAEATAAYRADRPKPCGPRSMPSGGGALCTTVAAVR